MLLCDSTFCPLPITAQSMHQMNLNQSHSTMIYAHQSIAAHKFAILSALEFPELRLIEYDCGLFSFITQFSKWKYIFVRKIANAFSTSCPALWEQTPLLDFHADVSDARHSSVISITPQLQILSIRRFNTHRSATSTWIIGSWKIWFNY